LIDFDEVKEEADSEFGRDIDASSLSDELIKLLSKIRLKVERSRGFKTVKEYSEDLLPIVEGLRGKYKYGVCNY